MSNAISADIIAAVSTAGFSVYMRNERDSWLYFTDGNRIGYLENSRGAGIKLVTVHIPNTTTGTGFGIADGLGVADLTRDKLSEALVTAPHWASSRDVASVSKWPNFEALKASSRFNGEYRLVAAAR